MEGGIGGGGSSSENSNSSSVYRECLRNHAASLGSYATDGCGEFTVDDMSPGGLQCAACGCHRNFHRKVKSYPPPTAHHHHHIHGSGSGRGGVIMEDYGGGGGGGGEGRPATAAMLKSAAAAEGERSGGGSGTKKRIRSKFTAEQKEKMLGFAEKLGWKLQRKDLDDEIERFCRGVGVSRQVFKVWMHNHKNSCSSSSASTGNVSSLTQ